MIRVLLVEDHASFRQALAFKLEHEPDITLVRQAGSLAEARTMVEGINIAVVDLALPDGSGIQLIRKVRQANPHNNVLILTASLDRTQVAQAVEAGAAGVLHKAARINEVIDAIRRLHAGEALLPLHEIVDLLRLAGEQREEDRDAELAIKQLTQREREVLQGLAQGLDSKAIAQQLQITVETERTHMVNILAKLGVHSRLQALVFAVRHGIVDIPPAPFLHRNR